MGGSSTALPPSICTTGGLGKPLPYILGQCLGDRLHRLRGRQGGGNVESIGTSPSDRGELQDVAFPVLELEREEQGSGEPSFLARDAPHGVARQPHRSHPRRRRYP